MNKLCINENISEIKWHTDNGNCCIGDLFQSISQKLDFNQLPALSFLIFQTAVPIACTDLSTDCYAD